MQLRIQNSEKKKFTEEESHVREIEMKFLDKDSSRQYSQVMEQIMKNNFRKESHASLRRSRSKASAKDFTIDPLNTSHFRTVVAPSRNQREKSESDKFDNIEIKSQEKGVAIAQIEEPHAKKIAYKFNFKSLLLQLFIAYSTTFILLYFISLGQFPYFQIILVIAFTVAIDPWRSSNLLMLIAIGIIFGNHFMGLGVFTYPSIAICYYSVLVFNQKYKTKQLFVVVLVVSMLWGFLVMKSIATSLFNQGNISTYAFLFPVLMLIIRIVVNYSYWVIDKTAVIFLQLPLFLTGLEYGAILSFDLAQIQFWYLLVAFSLQIINDRTQFLLNIVIAIKKSCSTKKSQQKDKDKKQKKKYRILPAHANGYACLHSFHLFILVYIYAGINFYTPPFSKADPIKIYMTPGYKPIIVWLLSSIYQILSILLGKNRKNILFFGFTSNKWWKCVLRGFVLSLGMWAFYLGLGLGVLTFHQTSG